MKANAALLRRVGLTSALCTALWGCGPRSTSVVEQEDSDTSGEGQPEPETSADPGEGSSESESTSGSETDAGETESGGDGGDSCEPNESSETFTFAFGLCLDEGCEELTETPLHIGEIGDPPGEVESSLNCMVTEDYSEQFSNAHVILECGDAQRYAVRISTDAEPNYAFYAVTEEPARLDLRMRWDGISRNEVDFRIVQDEQDWFVVGRRMMPEGQSAEISRRCESQREECICTDFLLDVTMASDSESLTLGEGESGVFANNLVWVPQASGLEDCECTDYLDEYHLDWIVAGSV